MSVAVGISFRDNATASIERLIQDVAPKRLAVICRDPCVLFWKQRLKSDIYKRNSTGTVGTKREAWARSVKGEIVDEGIALSAGDDKEAIGLRQRWLGGTISKKDKWLTIPISPLSRGLRAADFKDLFVLKTKSGRAYLVQYTEKFSAKGKIAQAGPKGMRRRATFTRRERAQGLVFLFMLVSQVTQGGNDQIVPTNDEFAEVCMARVTDALDKAIARNN